MDNRQKLMLGGAAATAVVAWAFLRYGKKDDDTGHFHLLNPASSELPISGQATFDDTCTDLSVRLDLTGFDMRITKRYWELRDDGVDEPVDLTAEILEMDAPDCEWPPDEDSSFRVREMWGLVLQAVTMYRQHEQAGTLPLFQGVIATGEF